MVYVSVQNGTGAGVRTVKPKPLPWDCACGASLLAHWNQCPLCKRPRP